MAEKSGFDLAINIKTAKSLGNATGFMMFEYSLCGKWPELLKEIAPSVTRVAVLRDAAQTAGIGQFAVIQSVAPSVGVDVSPINMSDAAEIERDVAAFAGSANGGLILTASALSALHQDLIITLAARYSCPRSTTNAHTSPPADWSRMGRISSTSIGAQPATSTASSRAKNQPICRCRRRPNTNWWSILRLQKRSGSRFHSRCLPAPTR